jgi:hypothetical protein
VRRALAKFAIVSGHQTALVTRCEVISGTFILLRSPGENPILPSRPINNETSPEFSSSIR